VLTTASRAVFTRMQSEHADERFYGFGFYHEPMWVWVLPTMHSEQALSRRAAHYQTLPYYTHKTAEQLHTQLRWSSGDWWEYLTIDYPEFAPVTDWLHQHYDLFERARDADWERYKAEYSTPMIELCRTVLRLLDAEGVFTRNQPRDHVVLNIMMGDQDNSWYDHAQALNPPSIYRRWAAEVEARYL
jgi:hypothetical protein